MVEPDRATGTGDLVAQVHAATEGPRDLKLSDRPRLEADERDGVVFVFDGVHERGGCAQHLDGAVCLAGEVADDLDAVAAQVDNRTASGQPAIPKPRGVWAGMGLPRPYPGHVADRPIANRADSLERFGRVAQVLKVAGKDARPLDRGEHPLSLRRGPPERFGAENRLAGLRGGGHRLLVEMVWQCHHDDVRIGVLDRRLH